MPVLRLFSAENETDLPSPPCRVHVNMTYTDHVLVLTNMKEMVWTSTVFYTKLNGTP